MGGTYLVVGANALYQAARSKVGPALPPYTDGVNELRSQVRYREEADELGKTQLFPEEEGC